MSELNIKKLLIMGGKPIGSCDIVNYAKSIGVYTIVTDNLPPSQSPAKLISDEYWDISTNDVSDLHKEIDKNKVDAIFTGAHEFNIRKTCELAEITGLPFYATREQIRITSEKDVYKKIFKKFGLPVVPEFNSNDYLSEDYDYPILVKPVDGNGGYGISICKCREELKQAYESALSISDKKEVIIEKFMNKKEVTIFYIIQDGEIYLSAMADRHVQHFNAGVIPLPVLYTFPSIHLSKFTKSQNLNTINTLKSLGLQNGMLFIQAFVDDSKYIYYDIGFRLTGTQEYNILEILSGYNPLKMLVDYSINKKDNRINLKDLVDPDFGGSYACNITFLALPGKIAKFHGLDEIKKMKSIIKTVINHGIGETIPKSALGTLNQVVLRVFAITESKKELSDLIKKVSDCFDVIDSNGDSIFIPINTDKYL